MGLLDLPGPLLGWIDAALASVPALLRVVLWGAAAGVLSMWFYRAVSPQARIAQAKQDQLDMRRRLDAFDGELSEAWPLIRRLLRLSLAHVGRVTGPAVLASLPVLCVLVWISTAYGHRFPEDGTPALRVVPSALDVRWLDGPGVGGTVELSDGAAGTTTEVPLTVPVTVIERWHWWNLLAGNPAGYLSDGHPARRVSVDLPAQTFVRIGPGWLRGWEAPFFAALITASLLMKRLLRIH